MGVDCDKEIEGPLKLWKEHQKNKIITP